MAHRRDRERRLGRREGGVDRGARRRVRATARPGGAPGRRARGVRACARPDAWAGQAPRRRDGCRARRTCREAPPAAGRPGARSRTGGTGPRLDARARQEPAAVRLRPCAARATPDLPDPVRSPRAVAKRDGARAPVPPRALTARSGPLAAQRRAGRTTRPNGALAHPALHGRRRDGARSPEQGPRDLVAGLPASSRRDQRAGRSAEAVPDEPRPARTTDAREADGRVRRVDRRATAAPLHAARWRRQPTRALGPGRPPRRTGKLEHSLPRLSASSSGAISPRSGATATCAS